MDSNPTARLALADVHNGAVSREAGTTHAPSGSFRSNARILTWRGTDKVVFRARTPDGEVCRGVIRF